MRKCEMSSLVVFASPSCNVCTGFATHDRVEPVNSFLRDGSARNDRQQCDHAVVVTGGTRAAALSQGRSTGTSLSTPVGTWP
jgi:hypothetical protein